MLRRPLLAVCLTACLAMVSACGSPCDEIADLTCAAAGVDSDECKQIRERAARADGETKETCQVALALRESLAKAR